MTLPTVYLGFGGNLGNPLSTLSKASEEISKSFGILSFEISAFYMTTPVSSIPQPAFINAVCRFKTEHSLSVLYSYLLEIEKKYGKVVKTKEEPRFIDIDILFFGTSYLRTRTLHIPHPSWHERLFVLRPLLDLTNMIDVPDALGNIESVDVEEKVIGISNLSKEKVVPVLSF